LFLSSHGYTQDITWSKYDIGQSIKVELPNRPDIIDTLGTRIIKSESDRYVILITTINNDQRINAKIPNDDELIKFYDGIIKGFKKSVNGELLKKEIINISNLTSVKYTFKVTRNGEENNYYVITFFVNNTVYSFQFYQSVLDYKSLEVIRERFFNSITVSKSLQHKDQFTSDIKTDSYNKGEVFGGYLFYIVFALIPIVFIIRKIRRKHITRSSSRPL
jgi:hypothetical protein